MRRSEVRVLFPAPHPSSREGVQKAIDISHLEHNDMANYSTPEKRRRTKTLLKRLYKITDELSALYPGRPFTPDGHPVGSIGEVIAGHMFNLKLEPPSKAGYDAVGLRGRKIQIKATQGNNISIRTKPEHLLVLKINPGDGKVSVIYNGPGLLVWEEYARNKRKGKNGYYLLAVGKLRSLMAKVEERDRLQLVNKW